MHRQAGAKHNHWHHRGSTHNNSDSQKAAILVEYLL
ncbi:hypothetical protein BN435_0600 [Erwinia amylovora 01SFR-BO]|nr:hypothetical protein BN432_0602 [Erwinia amylovora Ea356]CCO81217.1 hypothetical protein BN433_0612 [Erwinia amylovora Ea266]CCO85023.1 hypothetical protein BN434_0602 [Erwinia amylovora CFBP 2585]CCO88806.1 hypothetical protein BN435_0600 [Erwinia amylovora 01SFR-BO]CCO97916.1 hypothetical protein BN438_0600 [Erwinia amylovora UPN527]